jgi:hypothetical protein
VDQLNLIIERLDAIESRLAKLEGTNQTPKRALPTMTRSTELEAASETKEAPLRKFINKSVPYEKRTDLHPSKKKNSRNFLGMVGVACILLASLLLIQFTIESGWLTPFRQLILAGLFGSSLIAIPFFTQFEDKKYISQMPAMGVIVLNLVIYGAVFYHEMMGPFVGLICLSGVSLLSLWLLSKIEEDLYAALSIIGTYLGALFLSDAFEKITMLGTFLLVWDVTFVLYAINLKRRQMIAITGYLALGLVGFLGLTARPSELYQVIVLQFFQFFIFAKGTSLYSTLNKQILTAKEAWRFFPIIIFFYGQMYYFLDQIKHMYATIFAIGFAAFLFGIYKLAKRELDQTLESRDMVYTTITLIFAHAIYIAEFNDGMRMITIFVVLALFTGFKDKIENTTLPRGVKIIIGILILFAYIAVLFEEYRWGATSLMIYGTLFGVFGLMMRGALSGSKSALVMYMAHAQMVTSIWRLKEFIPEVYIAPLWILYAFVILVWSVKKSDELLAKGAIPLVVVGLGRFMLFQFFDLGTMQKIVSLFVMGGLIFAGGYLYRKVVKP